MTRTEMTANAPDAETPLDVSGIQTFRPQTSLWSTDTQELYAYWLSLRRDRTIAQYSDFDPLQVTSAISNVYILEVITAGEDFRISFLGAEIVRYMGGDATGNLMSALGEGLQIRRSRFAMRKVVNEKSPVLNRVLNGFQSGEDFLALEGLSLPLFSDDGTVSHIVGRTSVLRPNATLQSNGD